MGYRFGRSGSSGSVGRFLRLRSEIGDGKDDPEVTAFTGDFIECHGGLLLLGWGRLKSRTRVRAYRTHLTSELKVCAGLLFALNVQAAFELFCGIEKQPALFQVA